MKDFLIPCVSPRCGDEIVYRAAVYMDGNWAHEADHLRFAPMAEYDARLLMKHYPHEDVYVEQVVAGEVVGRYRLDPDNLLGHLQPKRVAASDPKSHPSVTQGNVQRWSVGELYPWTVVVIAGKLEGVGFCQPFRCVGGQRGPYFGYGECVTFKQAHRSAEEWIRRTSSWYED